MEFRIFTEPQMGATYADQLRVARATEDLDSTRFSAPTTSSPWAAPVSRVRRIRG